MFFNLLFPTRVSDGSVGGPMYKADVIEYDSGFESIDKKWPYPRMRYNINANTMTQDEIEEIYQFFWVVGAMSGSWLFQDPYDHKSCSYASTVSARDQLLLTNPSTAVTSVQLTKTYQRGPYTLERKITHPDVSTVVFMVDGSVRTTGFTVGSTTGIASFAPALASTVASVRVGFEYFVHARFDTQELPITYEGGLIGNARIPIIEKPRT